MWVVSDLDPPIRQMIDATNRGDSEDFLAAFADDAVLDDWGRTFTGDEEIAGWNARENIGVNSHIEVTGVERWATRCASACPCRAMATTVGARSRSCSPATRSRGW